MYLVIAQAEALPERRHELVELLSAVAAAARLEPGCLSYRFTTDIEDETAFSSIEVWENEDAMAAHLGSPELAQALGAMQSLLASEPTIIGYEVAGDPKRWA
jgi:quinol monooxygenase YgiN